MDRSPAALKFLFAFSMPALFVVLALVGGDRWGGYSLFAGGLAVAGAVCAAQLAGRRGNRYLAGIVYFVVVGLLLLVLP